jgi:hypothetical protein
LSVPLERLIGRAPDSIRRLIGIDHTKGRSAILSPKGTSAMEPMNDQFPVLKSGRRQLIDTQKVDEVRRVLWRAFQHGALSEEEFASTLDRLEFPTTAREPTLESQSRH